ncbi:MAG: hypothetical protein LBT84_06290 [Spirochaetia bacterium]|jgi:glucose-6-phosphate isomerase|nr:hypothetical protein [Spirochaetia bacterium]
MEKTLSLESKRCLALDLGRSYLAYTDIDSLCLETFPDEALDALQAFKNVMNGDIYDPGEENKGFSNHVGWLEPVKETLKPTDAELAAVKKAAQEIRAGSDILVFAASGPAYLAARSGVDFFDISGGSPEVLFLGCNTSPAYHKRLVEKLKGRRFSVCAVEDGMFQHESVIALNDIKAPEKFYVFSNNRESTFCAGAGKAGAEILISAPEFTKQSLILSPGALLPLAATGIDIDAVIEGAELEPLLDMESYVPVGCAGAGATRELFIPLSSTNIKNYSAARHLLRRKGYGMELFTYIDNTLAGFSGWLKYLFMSTASGDRIIHADALDLSMNMNALIDYAAANKSFFETFLHVGRLDRHDIGDFKTPDDLPALGSFLIMESMQKQRRSGVPIVRVNIPQADPYFYGQMISLFSRAAAVMDVWK